MYQNRNPRHVQSGKKVKENQNPKRLRKVHRSDVAHPIKDKAVTNPNLRFQRRGSRDQNAWKKAVNQKQLFQIHAKRTSISPIPPITATFHRLADDNPTHSYEGILLYFLYQPPSILPISFINFEPYSY